MDTTAQNRLSQYRDYVRQCLRVIQIAAGFVALIIILVIIIHNIFAPKEQDIPNDTIVSLFRFLPGNIRSFSEWPKNETHRLDQH